MARRVSRAHALGPLVIAALILATTGAGGLRADEIECEHAFVKLRQCCPPDFASTRVACEYAQGCGVTYEPVLSRADTRCIRERDCASLRAMGACERIKSFDYNYASGGSIPVPPEDAGEVTFGAGLRVCE